MALTSPDRIEMNTSQRQRLRHLIRAGTTAQQLVLKVIVWVVGGSLMVVKRWYCSRCVVEGNGGSVPSTVFLCTGRVLDPTREHHMATDGAPLVRLHR